MSVLKPIIVTLHHHRYDVTDFIKHHPGEKPDKNRSITNYVGQDISTIFDLYHAKPTRREKANSLLDYARELGEYHGIKYLGSL
jgi:cytochrome b involved in lipid metabolism